MQSCPILPYCYGPLRAVNGPYVLHKPSLGLTVRMLSTYGACISLLHEGTMRYGSFDPIRTVRRHTKRASHYYIRAQCVTVRSIRTVRRHTERASRYYIKAQCDKVRSIRTIRTAREAHSNCNIPRSINHKPTKAQKPRKALSKCNISRSINHKPTQAQSHTFLVL